MGTAVDTATDTKAAAHPASFSKPYSRCNASARGRSYMTTASGVLGAHTGCHSTNQ